MDNAAGRGTKYMAPETAWEKKRAELDGIERTGQRDDSYVLPW